MLNFTKATCSDTRQFLFKVFNLTTLRTDTWRRVNSTQKKKKTNVPQNKLI